MIARKKVSIAIKQDRMTACVSWHRDREQVSIERKRFLTPNYSFDSEPRRAIICMHYPLGLETLCILVMIRNVIPVRKKHSAHAAHLFNSFCELSCKPWRID